MLVIASTARVSKLADIEDSVRGTRIVIGEHASIDSFVKIKPAGGMGDLVIGDHTVINAGVVIYTGNGITIGSHVMIASNCVLSPASHEFMSRDTLIMKQGFIAPSPMSGGESGISIGDDVLIGANSVVLEGARVGRGAVITAGSIVKGTLEEYGIYAGSPLKCIGYRR